MSHRSLAPFLDFGLEADYQSLDLPVPEMRGESLVLPSSTLRELSRVAFASIAHRMPESQARGFAEVAADRDASEAERFVAVQLLRNAAVAAEGVLPICQDTGSAVVYGWKGARVSSGGQDEEELAAGAAEAWREGRLRASLIGPRGFLEESNTGDNLPALVDLRADSGAAYRLCFSVKGGGSANRTSLSMESPALLDPERLRARIEERVSALGASGCPPYRISLVLGGTGPDEALHVLALASLGLLDSLGASAPGDGSPLRDPAWEEELLAAAARSGAGAQFGGSRLALDARAIRLSRHAACLPFALGVACAAHRRARAIIDERGVRLERLEADPGRFLPRELPLFPGARRIDLDKGARAVAAELAALPAGSRLLLSGTVATARDAVHARWRRLMDAGGELPAYASDLAIFYAGPTEAPPGLPSGSFGPTTAGRMDSYLEPLMERGASLVTIAKGGRSSQAASAIARRGGAYLVCIGGAAALAAREHVVSSEVIDHADLGMEAVRRVVLRELPAMLAIDASGRDFYSQS